MSASMYREPGQVKVSSGRPHRSCCGGLQERPHTTNHTLNSCANWIFVFPSLCKLSEPRPPQLSQRSNNNGDRRTPAKWQPTHSSSSSALTCNKNNNFNKPHGKPPDKEKKMKRPKLTRPPKSNSEVPMFKSLDTETGDGSSSESDYPDPFT